LAKRALIAHPDTHGGWLDGIGVKLTALHGNRLRIEYVAVGAVERIKLPPPGSAVRREGLWQTTCFELFAREEDAAYREFNFAPSGEWAAYRFDDYRTGMTDLALPAPRIERTIGERRLAVTVEMDAGAVLRHGGALALSAVVEDVDGAKSYWALQHPSGPPDFHHPDCFALSLEAPGPA
jgi:hypothetical protein